MSQVESMRGAKILTPRRRGIEARAIPLVAVDLRATGSIDSRWKNHVQISTSIACASVARRSTATYGTGSVTTAELPDETPSLVPKLHLGTFLDLREIPSRANSGCLKKGSKAARTSAFPSATWEREKNVRMAASAAIPKGLNHIAQGWRSSAYPGFSEAKANPEGVVSPASGNRYSTLSGLASSGVLPRVCLLANPGLYDPTPSGLKTIPRAELPDETHYSGPAWIHADAKPGTQTSPDIDVEDKLKEAFSRGWSVIVWNDPVNLMDYVVYVFKTVLKMSEKDATRSTCGRSTKTARAWSRARRGRNRS